MTTEGASLVIHCKHWSRGRAALLRHLREHERHKVIAIQPDRYILATTTALSWNHSNSAPHS